MPHHSSVRLHTVRSAKCFWARECELGVNYFAAPKLRKSGAEEQRSPDRIGRSGPAFEDRVGPTPGVSCYTVWYVPSSIFSPNDLI